MNKCIGCVIFWKCVKKIKEHEDEDLTDKCENIVHSTQHMYQKM